MVFNRHLKALNLCNHSDTIACVLYELLVNFGIDYRGFPNPRSRFHKFQFCSIFKVLLRCHLFRNSLYIISHKSSFVKNFFRYFLKSFGFKIAIQAVATSFSGCPLARQLDYYSKVYDLCQALFSVFLTKFLLYFWARCILWGLGGIGTKCRGKRWKHTASPFSQRGLLGNCVLDNNFLI